MIDAEEKKEVYTKYERARMIGSRALQIAMGAPFLVKMDEKDLERINYNPLEVAKLEYEAGVIPLTVKRPLPVVDMPTKEDKEKKKAEAKPVEE